MLPSCPGSRRSAFKPWTLCIRQGLPSLPKHLQFLQDGVEFRAQGRFAVDLIRKLAHGVRFVLPALEVIGDEVGTHAAGYSAQGRAHSDPW
jgi:hypothetical protein